MNIEENIFKAINIIAKRVVEKTPRDVTVMGVIVPDNSLPYGVYRVKYGETTYVATEIGTNEYKTGESVYMLIPQNDRSLNSFIIGRAELKKDQAGEGAPLPYYENSIF